MLFSADNLKYAKKMFKKKLLNLVFASFIMPVYLSAGEPAELDHDKLLFLTNAKIQSAVNCTAACMCVLPDFTAVSPILLTGSLMVNSAELYILGRVSYKYYFGANDQNTIARKQIVISTMQLVFQSLASMCTLVDSNEMGCAFFLLAAATCYLNDE